MFIKVIFTKKWMSPRGLNILYLSRGCNINTECATNQTVYGNSMLKHSFPHICQAIHSLHWLADNLEGNILKNKICFENVHESTTRVLSELFNFGGKSKKNHGQAQVKNLNTIGTRWSRKMWCFFFQIWITSYYYDC